MVRLRSPSFYAGKLWVAEDYFYKRRYALPPAAVLLLIGCMQPQPTEDIISVVSEKLSLAKKDLYKLLDSLMEKQLLVGEFSDEIIWHEAVREQWFEKNWQEAAEYHLATYDYKFVGTSKEGLEEHQRRMESYSQVAPDTNRSKRYDNSKQKISMPFPSAELTNEEGQKGRGLDREKLTNLLTLTFSATRKVEVPWNGAPLLRKTSPSGGGRHPSEGYAVVIDVPGIDSGWYHICSDPPELTLLSGISDKEDLLALFPTTYGRAPFSVRAIVLITCVFDRNMFRYREPRTFRTIHMDAGHLSATLEMLAGAIGVRCYPQYAANEKGIEKKLGLHGLDEGFMMSLALG